MNKRSAFILALALIPAVSQAQDKPYLEDLPHYIQNFSVFGEGQEEGRAFHIPSTSISLNGTWKFLYSENPAGVPKDFFLPGFSDRKWDDITVPSNWEMQGFGQQIFRNVSLPWHYDRSLQVPMDVNPTGSYRKTFTIPSSWKGSRIFLRFEKVASASFVWVNGQQVGYNEGGQEPSEYDITEYVRPGRNTLAVMVLKYSDGYFLEDQDYWRLAGIFDDVTVYSTPLTRIWDWQVITDFDKSYTDSDLTVAIDIRSFERASEGLSVSAEVSKDGRSIARMESRDVSVGADARGTVRLGTKVLSPEKWSAETPSLYDLEMTLSDASGKVIDRISKKIGFKKTEIIDGVFYLNGQPIKVSAECSHMQHPTLGHAVDEATVRKDIEILKQFNFNGVRTSHYPPVNEYLDLADKYGLYIIDETGDESHATEWVSGMPEFTEMYKERVRQMVLRDRNHPCVLFWSAGNESGEGPNITEVVKEGKKYDPTRYFMYGGNGANHPAEDIVGPRYPIPIEHELIYGTDPQDRRPSFMDEYLSVAGNAGGGFDDFWREIDAHPSLIGGAVWDFVSTGILEPVRTLEDKSPYGTMVNIMGRARLVPGRTGRAIDLNKRDQWVQVYRAGNVEIDGDRLTLTLDVFPRKYNSDGGYLITKGSNQFGIRQLGADKIEFYIDNGGKVVLTGDLPSGWEGSWHNVTAVYDGSKMSLYIDSEEIASCTASGPVRNLPLSVCIGRDEERHGQETNEYICDALIDNVGIFADAIAPSEGFDPARAALWLDFEKETANGDFYSYGIGARTYGSIWPDRTPQPEMYQMKKSTQPVSYRLLDPRDGTVEIRNRNCFVNASVYKTTWTLTADGDVISSGVLDLDIEPRATAVVRIPYAKPDIQAGKEYRLTVSSCLAKDELWAPEGHEVAWEQFELSSWNIPAPAPAKPAGKAVLANGGDSITVSGEGFRYSFDPATGALCSMVVGGTEMISRPLAFNVWRAPLANELDSWDFWSIGLNTRSIKEGYGAVGASQVVASMYYSSGLDRLIRKPVSIDSREIGGSVYIDVREYNLIGGHMDSRSGFETVWSFRIDADGTITLHNYANPQGEMPGWLPRIGITMSLQGSLGNVEWYGRGPQASYPDRKTGYRIGKYGSTVEDMYEPYLIPQDYGLRSDTRWVRFTDGNGMGLEFRGDIPFAFNAYPFTTENLTKSVYQYQLQKSGDITFNLDYATSGVGCTARGIFDAYKAYPAACDRTVVIRPVGTAK